MRRLDRRNSFPCTPPGFSLCAEREGEKLCIFIPHPVLCAPEVCPLPTARESSRASRGAPLNGVGVGGFEAAAIPRSFPRLRD